MSWTPSSLKNFKWMMTYIVDYKGDIPGSLFMAAQTYVWDHQTFKGRGRRRH